MSTKRFFFYLLMAATTLMLQASTIPAGHYYFDNSQQKYGIVQLVYGNGNFTGVKTLTPTEEDANVWEFDISEDITDLSSYIFCDYIAKPGTYSYPYADFVNNLVETCTPSSGKKNYIGRVKEYLYDAIPGDIFMPRHEYRKTTSIWTTTRVPYITNKPLPSNPEKLEVLFLGNSFTVDLLNYIREMTHQSTVDDQIYDIYAHVIGAAGFSTFIDRYDNDTPGFSLYRYAGQMWTKKTFDTMKEVLEYDWDVIVITPGSFSSTQYYSIEPDICELVDRIREGSNNPNLCIACVMPWLTNADEGSQNVSLMLQRENYHYIMERVGVDVIIPASAAVENLRTVLDNDGHNLTRDKWHLCYGAGQYVAAATVYETIFAPVFGISIFDNPYLHPLTDAEKEITSSNQYPGIDVDEEVALLCKKAVREAIRNPFVTTDLNTVE